MSLLNSFKLMTYIFVKWSNIYTTLYFTEYQILKYFSEMPYNFLKVKWNNKIKYGSSLPDVFLEQGVLKICSKFTGEHPCRGVIPIKLQSNFSIIEITLRHGFLLQICCVFSEHLFLRTPLDSIKITDLWKNTKTCVKIYVG